MSQEEVINYVVLTIVVGSLVIGLISMLFGKLVDMWDAFYGWWGRGVQKAIHARPVKPRDMSSNAPVPLAAQRLTERRSYAVEPSWEQDGSQSRNPVPYLAAQLGTLSDDARLEVLARMIDADGKYVYADSRIAKFIGGRVEDRVAQVRDIRGTEPPPPRPQAILRVRDNGHERLIAKYGK